MMILAPLLSSIALIAFGRPPSAMVDFGRFWKILEELEVVVKTCLLVVRYRKQVTDSLLSDTHHADPPLHIDPHP